MPKNKGKGGKNRRRGKNQASEVKRDLVYKNDMQEYAQVKKMLGGAWVEAFCFDGKERRCHIPGSFRKKVWIQQGNIILVSLREFDDRVADIIHKYFVGEARSLIALKELPDTVDLSYSGVQFDQGDDDVIVDFDYFGYLRNPDAYRRIRSTGVLGMDEEQVEMNESLQEHGINPVY